MKNALTLFAAAAVFCAHAETKRWIGPTNVGFNNPSYWEPAGTPTAEDDAIIDNGTTVRAVSGQIRLKSLTVSGEGSALLLGSTTLAPQTIAEISGDLTVTDKGALYVTAGELTDLSVFADAITDQTAATAAIYANPTVVSVGGTFTVSDGAAVYPENAPVSGAAVFFKPKDFVLGEGACFDTRNLGWGLVTGTTALTQETLPAGAKFDLYNNATYLYTFAFGAGYRYEHGAGYGGRALEVATAKFTTPVVNTWTSGGTYGSAYAPFLSGSPSGYWGSQYSRASGSIVVLATGAVTLAGTMEASGKPNMSYTYLPGTSGGSIWISGDTVDITKTSSLCASGGICRATYAKSPGGGGRISICSGMEPADWDVIAATTALPEGYVSAQMYSPGVVSVAGAPNPQGARWAYDGTTVVVVPEKNHVSFTVASVPRVVIADGLNCSTTLVNTENTLEYTVSEYGGDPSDPTAIQYPCVGWVVSNATEEVASGTGNTASFNIDWREGPHTLTWIWGEALGARTYRVRSAGCGTITVNGVENSSDVVIPMTGAETDDVISASAAEGCRFVGWTGLPCGFSTNATVTVPAEVGGLVTAIFIADDAVTTEKVWKNLSGDGRWDNPMNWDPTGEPTVTDDVVVSGSDCFVPFSAVAGSVTVSSGCELYLSATNTVSAPLAENSVTRRHRHFFIARDLNVAGGVVFGGAGATWTNMAVVVGGDMTMSGDATAVVFAAPLDETIESTSTNLYNAATVFSVGGDMAVGGSSVLKPVCDEYTGTAVRFEVGGSLTVGPAASVNADGAGWYWRAYTGEGDALSRYSGVTNLAGDNLTTTYETRAYEVGHDYRVGAGHGNCGRAEPNNSLMLSKPYGFSAAPFLPGSPGGLFNVVRPPLPGGGVAWFWCGERIILDGKISASAQEGAYYGGSSGGSVWLAASGIMASPDAVLAAVGGATSDREKYLSSGSGGRISVVLGATDAELDALAMGETPENLSYGSSIEMFTADASGGADGTKYGTVPRTYAPAGTVAMIRSPAAEKSVLVRSSVRAGSPSPMYGTWVVTPGDQLSFVATETGYGADPVNPDGARWTCVGYVISNAVEQIASGATSSFSIGMPDEDITVTWLWTAREVAVAPESPVGGGLGSVTIDAAAYTQGESVWKSDGSVITLAAVAGEGSEFLYWAGEFPFGQAKSNPLEIAATDDLVIRPVFRIAAEKTTRTWQGADKSQGEFMDPSKWSGGIIPGLEDDVVIASGFCFSTNANYIEVGSLVVSNDLTRFYLGMHSAMNGNSVLGGLGFIAGYEDAVGLVQDVKAPDRYLRCGLSENTDEVALVAAGDIVVASNAHVCVGVPFAGVKAHGRLSAENLALADGSQLAVVAGRVGEGESFTYAGGAGFIDVAGDLTVADTAVLRPFSDPKTGGSVKISADTFTLGPLASVNAKGTGYVRFSADPAECTAPGRAHNYQIGAGHGGAGCYDPGDAFSVSISDKFGLAYGQLAAPVQPGSPNGEYNSPFMRGGGLIRVHARSMAIAGTVDASAQERAWSELRFFGGASGGGIWLTAGSLDIAEGAVLDVHGGYSTYGSGGSGGRIAVGEIAAADAISSFAATGAARGYKALTKTDFAVKYPGVTVNVSHGVWYTDMGVTPGEHVLKDAEYAYEDGTFAYVVQKDGAILILR